MTENVLYAEKLDLVIWPETALPFNLDSPGAFPQEIRETVDRWRIPLITGGYAAGFDRFLSDYNAAFYLEPSSNVPKIQIYRKNILLAFGEYMPFGETFPWLYRAFPQVSNFMKGKTQEPFEMHDGTRLGVTICYEAIVPEFFRKVVQNGVRVVINLTNDSWFGPTIEPYQHGALSVFRAVETRLPLIRVTNTGVSFVVDILGRLSKMTGVYEPGILVEEVAIPSSAPQTVYVRFGDWFVGVCALILTVFIFIGRRQHASVSF
ncbi:MAG: apolipoprotein N-acyltransferase [Deltaproteobacteria bacterium]|nr:apolipoprotein N-acyltransferase [Deltaproteobacteria bacterium]